VKDETIKRLAQDIGDYRIHDNWTALDAIAALKLQQGGDTPRNSVILAGRFLEMMARDILETGYLRDTTADEMAVDQAAAKPESAGKEAPDWKTKRGLR